MFFHSFDFFLLFATVFAVYWALRWHGARMWWLFAASCIFYMSWNPWFLLLIGFTAAIDYVFALRIERAQSLGQRRWLLAASIIISVSILSLFKYSGFVLDNLAALMQTLGMGHGWTFTDLLPHAQRWDLRICEFFQRDFFQRHHIGWQPHPFTTLLVPKNPADDKSPVSLLLPLGISFYTFETISYVVDVYLGRMKAVRSIRNYALFIMFFPHLLAGPIVRPREFLPQTMQRKTFDWDRLQWGAQLFLRGLFKKAVLADWTGLVAEKVFAKPAEYSSSSIWLAMFCYVAQVYCDFSGYSDMALGTAHALGFKLPVNFRMPLFSASIGEFWRRWHVTLSSWLRDYLYIPLGGNRTSFGWARMLLFAGLAALAFYAAPHTVGTAVQSLTNASPGLVTLSIWIARALGVAVAAIFLFPSTGPHTNLLLTMILCGLWHGAGWNFVLFGLIMGLLLTLERLARPVMQHLQQPILTPFKVTLTLLTFAFTLVVFRSPTMPGAWTMYQRLIVPTAGTAVLSDELVWMGRFALLALLCGHLIGQFVNVKRLERNVWPIPAAIAMIAVFVLVQVLMPTEGGAFIYFQF